MKVASLREVRHHFSEMLALVESGEPVQIARRGKIVARLVSDHEEPKKFVVPNFKAQLGEVFGSDYQKRMLSEEDSKALRHNMRGER